MAAVSASPAAAGPLPRIGLVFPPLSVIGGRPDLCLSVVGGALPTLALFFPQGVMGTVRARLAPWLP